MRRPPLGWTALVMSVMAAAGPRSGGMARRWGAFAVLALVMLAIAFDVRAQRASTPNIVIILADDMGYGDLSSFGNPNVKSTCGCGSSFSV